MLLLAACCCNRTAPTYYPLLYCPEGTEQTGQAVALTAAQLTAATGKVYSVPGPAGFGYVCVVVGTTAVDPSEYEIVSLPVSSFDNCDECCDCNNERLACNSTNLPTSLILHIEITLAGAWTRVIEFMVYRGSFCSWGPTMTSLDYRAHDPTWERMVHNEAGTLVYKYNTPTPADPEEPVVYPLDEVQLEFQLDGLDFNGQNESYCGKMIYIGASGGRIHDAENAEPTVAQCYWYLKVPGYCVPQVVFVNPATGGMIDFPSGCIVPDGFFNSTLSISNIHFI